MNLKTIDRRLAAILLVVFVGIAGASLILPILPLYAGRQFGLTPQLITLLNTSFFAAQFVAGPFLGRLSDKYGRVPILIISQIGTAISFLMIAFAPNAAMLFAARILDGITGGNIIVAQAYVTDITPKEKRTQALGYIFAVFGVGFMFGPVLGGGLARFGVRVPYIVAAVAAFAVVLLTWFVLDESLTPEQRLESHNTRKTGLGFGEVISNVPLLLILLITFVGQFAFGLFQSTFSLYGAAVLFKGYSEDSTNLGIGLIFAAVGLSQLLTQMFLIRWALKRFNEATVVAAGNLFRMIGLAIFAVITTPWLGPLGSLFFAMGMGFAIPAAQSLATRTVSENVRGGVLGIYQSISNLAVICSSAIAGVIFASHPTLPFWLGAVLAAVALIPSAVLMRRMGNPVGKVASTPIGH